MNGPPRSHHIEHAARFVDDRRPRTSDCRLRALRHVWLSRGQPPGLASRSKQRTERAEVRHSVTHSRPRLPSESPQRATPRPAPAPRYPPSSNPRASLAASPQTTTCGGAADANRAAAPPSDLPPPGRPRAHRCPVYSIPGGNKTRTQPHALASHRARTTHAAGGVHRFRVRSASAPRLPRPSQKAQLASRPQLADPLTLSARP